jgi:hypothetical protein
MHLVFFLQKRAFGNKQQLLKNNTEIEKVWKLCYKKQLVIVLKQKFFGLWELNPSGWL